MDPDEPERTQSNRFTVTLTKMTADKKTGLSGAVGGESPVCFSRVHERKIRGSDCSTRRSSVRQPEGFNSHVTSDGSKISLTSLFDDEMVSPSDVIAANQEVLFQNNTSLDQIKITALQMKL